MKTILVVDDEKHVCLLYEEELKDEGYNVLTAFNGREALDILAKQMPDLVLLDLKMPEMDGAEFLRQVRMIHKNLPIIISTAYGDYAQQDFSVWLSNDYLVKSADFGELKAKVRKILGE
jgi:DNA-binding response OmpR family regulator